MPARDGRGAAVTASVQAVRAPRPVPLLGRVALLWGVGGFTLLLGVALWRLTDLALASTAYPWGPAHWSLFAANLLFMGWIEGYRGFQCRYSPRFAARAHWLSRHAAPWQAVLAPLLCMGFVHATRRRLLSAWLLTVAIVGVVLLYRTLPQPWRGILDAGVVVGLAWGLIATLFAVRQALREGPQADPEIPQAR